MKHALAVFALILVIPASSAFSQTTTITYDAVVDRAYGPKASFFPSGERVVISYTLDPSVPDRDADPLSGFFYGAVPEISVSFPGSGIFLTTDRAGGSTAQTFNNITDAASGYWSDQFAVRGWPITSSSSLVGGESVDGVEVGFLSAFLMPPVEPTMLSSDALPLFSLPTNDATMFLHTSEGWTQIDFSTAAPPSDRDGDGIADSSDACPDEPGDAAHNGCPPDWNTDIGSDVPVELAVPLPDGTGTTVSLTFEKVDAPGDTSATGSSNGPPPASGFKLGSPPVYYEITTTATFTGSVRVCIYWTEGQFANESHIRLFHRQDSDWVDITDPASLDTVNNTVCGVTTSFSPFALLEVKYPFAGFFPPVDAFPVVNSVKAGAAVPVKFSLGGDLGLEIFAAGYPQTELVQCETGSAIDNIETTVTAGGSSLTYDVLTGQYTYVWKTNQTWAGSCRVLNVKFDDGELYSAKFSFRK